MTQPRLLPLARNRALLRSCGTLSILAGLAGLTVACSDAHAGAAAASPSSPRQPAPAPSRPRLALADKAIPAHQSELLDLAFQAASALPLAPHIKNRARAQEAVVAACLELDQPRRALACADEIPNWRQGAAYADIAHYCAEHGDTSAVAHYLDLALRTSEDEEIGQDWRRERIRAKVAKTHALLGDTAAAQSLADTEGADARASRALEVDVEHLDEELASLQGVMRTGNLDEARDALIAAARLFDRFYGDASARSRVDAAMEAAWEKVPVMIRIETVMSLTRCALDHEDPPEATRLVEKARQVLDAHTWTPEDQITTAAKLASLRYEAGRHDVARTELDAARAAFDEQKAQIVDIYRAGVLRALAEAYQTTRQPEVALVVYAQALEEGVHNPNSRPRAEDLSATCVSMAVHGVEPDAAVRGRMKAIYQALGAPW